MPKLLPGQQVKIESFVFNGYAVINNVGFSGCNFTNNWSTDMVCLA